MKLGKHPPQRDPLAHLKAPVMARFLSETAPLIPDEFDWMSGISDWGMMRNDKVGCCTYAGIGHAVQAMSAATGSEYTVSDSTVIRGYSALTGYDPSQDTPDGENPTDQGANELDVLNWFKANGFGGKRLLDHAPVPLDNNAQLKKAMYLFCGGYIGLALPKSAQSQTTWDVVLNSNDNQPGSWGLHCVHLLGADKRVVRCATWRWVKEMTWDFLRVYCDEFHALLMEDWLNFAAKDFKLGDLQAELAAVTS